MTFTDEGRYTREEWGPWSLDIDTACLHLRAKGWDLYYVDLERCQSSGQVLDWIAQLAGKRPSFLSDEDLGRFIRVINEVLHPQQNLCSLAVLGADDKEMSKELIWQCVRRYEADPERYTFAPKKVRR